MSKKIPIYFSDQSWAQLQNIMGKEGKPSQVINTILSASHLTPHGARQIVKTTVIQIPLALESVSAGFPSPAQDHTEQTVDLNSFLVGNALATFIVDVNSLSMLNAGIDIGDKLIVDRSLEAKQDDIVIALIDNEFTVKRLKLTPSVYLQAENPDYENIYFKEGQELFIWGVVTNIIKPTRKK